MKNSVAIVTGASSVIGKATAIRPASDFSSIILVAREGEQLAEEDGVQVNCVSPGAVLTGRRLGMFEKSAAKRNISLEDVKRTFLKQAGVSRFGEPEEIAELFAFVVSPKARYITGTVLRMDSGEVKSN